MAGAARDAVQRVERAPTAADVTVSLAAIERAAQRAAADLTVAAEAV
jgi:hypothetical protein